MILRKLDQSEHGKTRPLWEEVFVEDTKDFLDYYYYIKTRDNQIYVVEEDGQIRSMLQLNPYTLKVGSKELPSAYIIAVATRKAFRGRGFMGALLRTALEDMYQAKIPFTFLMPAAEAIYTPYDFRFIYDQCIGSLKQCCTQEEQRGDACDFSDAALWNAEEIADFFNAHFSEKWQVYAVRDAAYYQTVILEQSSEHGGVRLIREGGEIKGVYAYATEEGLEIREPLYLEGYENAFFRSVRQLAANGQSRIKDEDIKIYACPEYMSCKRKPIIMARIVCLPELMRTMTVPENLSVDCSFAVIDPLIRQNSRVWRVTSAYGELKLHVRETEDSEGVLPVDLLTELLFGRVETAKLADDDRVVMTEHLTEELDKITKFTKIFLNEVV